MKATALQSSSRDSVGGINLAVVIIFALVGLVLTSLIVNGPGVQSPEIDMVSP